MGPINLLSLPLQFQITAFVVSFLCFYRQHFAASCFKNGWTATVPELINVSEDQLVPPQVIHMHIPCSAELRLPGLAAVLKSELSEDVRRSIVREGNGGEVDDANSAVNTLGTVDNDSIDRAVFTKQAIVFVDEREAHLIDTYAYSAIKTLEKMSTASVHEIEDSKSTVSNTKPVNMRKAIEQQSRVGVLLESVSLEARARVLDNFRYFFVFPVNVYSGGDKKVYQSQCIYSVSSHSGYQIWR